MILAIDIGNTTVALGGIRDGRVCFVARMDTVRTRTAAEYRAEMDKIFAHRRHPERPMRFEGAVLTSVVPQITGALAECARHYTGKKPVIVSPDIRTGLTMGVDEPRAVGKDRLVDAAYAAANFPLPVITVDLGTATTFNVVDKDRVFRGGVICPGLSTGLRALGDRCAQLPQVHLGSPKKAIGTNTESCMLSGSVLGTAVLIDGMVQRIEVCVLLQQPAAGDPRHSGGRSHGGGRHYGQQGRLRAKHPHPNRRTRREPEALVG